MSLHNKKNALDLSLKRLFFIVTLPLLLLLVACGADDEGQDQGSSSQNTQVFSGVVLNGPLARATVYLDSNDNRTRDSWEEEALTDSDGYYSYNPLTQTDYCAENISQTQSLMCLETPSQLESVVIRVEGGYDAVTGQAYIGQMSRRIELDSNSLALENNQTNETTPGEKARTEAVISPITSLLTDIKTEAEKTVLLNKLNISDLADLDTHYLDINTDGTSEIDPKLLSTAIKIDKTVIFLANNISNIYSELGSKFGLVAQAESFVYEELAQKILQQGQKTLDELLSEPADISDVLLQAENYFNEHIGDRAFVIPDSVHITLSEQTVNRIVATTNEINPVVNSVFNSNFSELTSSVDVEGAVRALEVFIIKGLKSLSEINQDDIKQTIEFYTNDESKESMSLLIKNLSEWDNDLPALINSNFSLTTLEELINSSTKKEGNITFKNLAGASLNLTNIKRENNEDSTHISLYFDGDLGDEHGSFTACTSYLNKDGIINDGQTNEEAVEQTATLINGFWSLLNVNPDINESYTVALTFNFENSSQPAILTGSVADNDSNATDVQFDYDGNSELLYSDDGVSYQSSSQTIIEQECGNG